MPITHSDGDTAEVNSTLRIRLGILAAALTLPVLAACGPDGKTGPAAPLSPSAAAPATSIAPPTPTAVAPTPTSKPQTVASKPSAPRPKPSQSTEQAPPPAGPPTSSVRQGVHPGAFCSSAGEEGVTSTGKPMVCKTSDTDSRLRWRAA